MAELIWEIVAGVILIVVLIKALRWWLRLLDLYPGLFESDPIVPREPKERGEDP